MSAGVEKTTDGDTRVLPPAWPMHRVAISREQSTIYVLFQENIGALIESSNSAIYRLLDNEKLGPTSSVSHLNRYQDDSSDAIGDKTRTRSSLVLSDSHISACDARKAKVSPSSGRVIAKDVM
jgi:hypothetical protein